jgi:hypothetical protein
LADDTLILIYEVEYLADTGSVKRTANVAIGGTSNHVTTFGDIPKILAVSNGLGQHPERVVILSAVLVRTDPSPLRLPA